MSAIQSLMASYANPLRVVDAADFPGVGGVNGSYLARGADLTGVSDGKKGILSLWFRLDSSAIGWILDDITPGGGFVFSYNTSSASKMTVLARNAADSTILQLHSATSYSSSATWHHLLASWDLGTPLARHLYIDDVSDLSVSTFTDDTIDYTEGEFIVGASGNFVPFNGALAEVYFAPGQYLDISVLANRRKFVTSAIQPVHLGLTGALPTGLAPALYLHLDDGEDVGNFALNRGTGGDFVASPTALSIASSSPSD